MSEFAEFHDELRTVARKVLDDSTPVRHHGDPGPIVTADVLADTGWLSLEVPESLGGAGATFTETAVVLVELGRAAATSGFVGTAVLGVGALLAAEQSDRRDALLTAAATGERTLSVVFEPAGPTTAFTVTRDGGADGTGRLSGTVEFALDADGADTLLVVADSTDGPVLVVADSDRLGIEATPVVDATHRLATVTADGVPVAADAVLRFAGDPAAAVAALVDRLAVAVACDSLGLAEAMLDATVEYAGQRRQFDRAIGSFQAVKHQCADMLVRTSIARELVDAAVAGVAAGADAGVPAAMAKSYACDAAVAVAGTAMQLHGGIGYTWESGIHVYLKRAAFDRALAGTPAAHRRRVAARYADLSALR